MPKYMSRKKVKAQGIETYNLVLDTEDHHDHPIIEDEHGTLRWEENPTVRELIDSVNLNDVVGVYFAKGWNKNSEQMRRLYRDMGYSLSGYWEIFYWDWNNEDWAEYRKDK